MLNICEKYAREYNILCNATKSQLMYFSKDSNNDIVKPVLSMDNVRKFLMLLNVYIWVIVLVLNIPNDL